MFLYGQRKPQNNISSIKDADTKPTEQGDLFEYVARENGPLEQYHPQMLLQCLLWGAEAYFFADFRSRADAPPRAII